MRNYMYASFCLLGLALLGVGVMFGVMYWQPPYIGLHPALASSLALTGFGVLAWASSEIVD